jgi:hypothetical protein
MASCSRAIKDTPRLYTSAEFNASPHRKCLQYVRRVAKNKKVPAREFVLSPG